MGANDIVAKARQLYEHKATAVLMADGWNEVCDAVQKWALARRSKPKVFEVHHMTEVARVAFLTACIEGRFDSAVSEALTKIGLA